MKMKQQSSSEVTTGNVDVAVDPAVEQPLMLLDMPVRNAESSPETEGSSIGQPGQLNLARLLQISDDGYLLSVEDASGASTEHLAHSCLCSLTEADINTSVVVGCLAGSSEELLVLGKLATSGGVAVDAEVDGEKVLVRGKERVVIQCGKSSITLTAAGKVIIKGDYVCSDSKGVNRLRGGSIQLN
jgi:hypothetical protein